MLHLIGHPLRTLISLLYKPMNETAWAFYLLRNNSPNVLDISVFVTYAEIIVKKWGPKILIFPLRKSNTQAAIFWCSSEVCGRLKDIGKCEWVEETETWLTKSVKLARQDPACSTYVSRRLFLLMQVKIKDKITELLRERTRTVEGIPIAIRVIVIVVVILFILLAGRRSSIYGAAMPRT